MKNSKTLGGWYLPYVYGWRQPYSYGYDYWNPYTGSVNVFPVEEYTDEYTDGSDYWDRAINKILTDPRKQPFAQSYIDLIINTYMNPSYVGPGYALDGSIIYPLIADGMALHRTASGGFVWVPIGDWID